MQLFFGLFRLLWQSHFYLAHAQGLSLRISRN